MIVQPSGVNDLFFKEHARPVSSDSFQVVTVANLYPKKNLDLVLEIAKELKEINFKIVGEGPEQEKLHKKIIQEGIDNVRLLGFKNSAELKKIYDQSDCYLLTSLAEGTPTSALEAMACGLPIISSNAGGINQIIKEFENGFIVENYDIGDFITRIKLLKSDVQLRMKIYENNLRLSHNFSWEKVAKMITNKTIECLNDKN